MDIRPTDYYLAQLKAKHATDLGFGLRAECPAMLSNFLDNHQVESIVDFGCGKGALVDRLAARFPHTSVQGYDPAFTPDFEWPEEVGLVLSTDVMEHLERDKLSDTVAFLESRACYHYHLIACHKATALLPDGRNAHLIVQTPDWWQSFFYDRGVEVLDEGTTSFIKRRPRGGRSLAVTHYEILYKVNATSLVISPR